MKTLFTTLLLLIAATTFAQQVDSLEINLRKYKDLYEKGLIERDEYEALKNKLLNNSMKTAVPQQKQTKELDQLAAKFKGTFTAGVAISVIGHGFGVGWLVMKNKRDETPTSSKDYQSIEEKTVVLGICGIALTTIGCITVLNGASGAGKYHKQKKLTTGMTRYGVGVTFSF